MLEPGVMGSKYDRFLNVTDLSHLVDSSIYVLTLFLIYDGMRSTS